MFPCNTSPSTASSRGHIIVQSISIPVLAKTWFTPSHAEPATKYTTLEKLCRVYLIEHSVIIKSIKSNDYVQTKWIEQKRSNKIEPTKNLAN